MKKFTHKDRPDFNSYSEEEKIVLLNTLYDSELNLIDECADLRDSLSIAQCLIEKLVTKHEGMLDAIDAYNRDQERLAKEIRDRAQLPLDNSWVE